jgi:hypothetical protein
LGDTGVFKFKFVAVGLSPLETGDGRLLSRKELPPHRTVASISAVKVLAARRHGISESMIRNSANRFPKFWVTEQRD